MEIHNHEINMSPLSTVVFYLVCRCSRIRKLRFNKGGVLPNEYNEDREETGVILITDYKSLLLVRMEGR